MRGYAFLLALLPAPVLAEADPNAVIAIEQCIATATDTGRERDCIGVLAGSCMQAPDGQTTVGMMFCVSDETDAWDVLLNREYQAAQTASKAMDAYETSSEYAVRAEQLLAAQRAWLKFREANCAAAYGIYGSGTMRQTAGANCYLNMTAERTLELRTLYNLMN